MKKKKTSRELAIDKMAFFNAGMVFMNNYKEAMTQRPSVSCTAEELAIAAAGTGGMIVAAAQHLFGVALSDLPRVVEKQELIIDRLRKQLDSDFDKLKAELN